MEKLARDVGLDDDEVELEALNQEDDKDKPIIKGQKTEAAGAEDKKAEQPPASERPSPHFPILGRIVHWILSFIGRDATEEEEKKRQQQQIEMAKHLDEIANLEQTKWQKAILYTNLFIILSGALGFYVYFSINPFTMEQIHNIQQEVLSSHV